ncbi:hypothetical protein [Nitrobacter sp. TKz-YC02]|uniref:hypothetical protein n=1 Tax=Nitrobacter sp. TKz-YC02 TaxID=3398704 RepID=UPI003CF88BAD
MTNADILAKVILDIDLVLVEHIQPYRTEDPHRAVEKILTILVQAKAVEIAERVQVGYGKLTLVK